MANRFPRMARLLAGESTFGTRLLLTCSFALLAAWVLWFVRARVPVYATSEHARLEVARTTDSVDAPITGRVVVVPIGLGSVVAVGDVLVEFDASAEKLQLAEARARVRGIQPQIEAIQRQISAEDRALAAFRDQRQAALVEAKDKLREGEILAQSGTLEAERARWLFSRNAIPEADLLRLQAEAERKQVAEAVLQAGSERLRRESGTGERDRMVRLTSLQRDLAQLESDLAVATATAESLEHAIALRTIRAPAGGRVGEIGSIRVGSVLAQGQHIATITANGDLRVVASFSPTVALGRVRPGQRARIRLDGFPWTEFGAIGASVTHVATELRDGLARVELEVDRNVSTRIPLQHGLPGVAEVTVEEVTPATLVLRAVGRRPDGESDRNAGKASL